MSRTLPAPEFGREAAERWVGEHLAGLFAGDPVGSERFRGGQSFADAALDAYDVTGYAARRNQVWPPSRRGASALSPYIRHGLITLPAAWRHVAGGPAKDVGKFRDELLWQEFARHWYARLGTRTRRGVRRELAAAAPTDVGVDGWDRTMVCLDETVGELERDGWLVNQTRMWLSSQWSVRSGWRWQDGEDAFFRELLDGSRAANRLGWQWTTGVGSSKHYGFSRWQVEKRTSGWCTTCPRRHDCPIERWPDDPAFTPVERPAAVKQGPGAGDLTGPTSVESDGSAPKAVWLTAESLGTDDPAAAAHPDLPIVFVFDRPLLERLRLSAKRLVFLTEILAEWAQQRDVEVHVGRPADVLADRPVAVTHAPVPGFGRLADRILPAETHPWPWLALPGHGSFASFSAWRRSVQVVI
ncbi:MAG: FAD-binding domain-containing protein [Actinomycetota bacterium]